MHFVDVAQKPAHQIDQMGADIAERPRAHFFFARMPAAELYRIGVIEMAAAMHRLAEAAGHPFFLDRLNLRMVARVVGNLQFSARLFGGTDHRPAFRRRDRHRLLAQHMFTSRERRQGMRFVQIVGPADPHRVDRFVGDEIGEL